MNRYEATDIGTKEVRACDSCGAVVECTFDADPYASEIGGNDTPLWQCESCVHESAMDI